MYALLYLVCHYNGSESMYWDGVWSVRTSVSVPVFSSCQYMCTTFVSPYLLSSVCFKWHMCIVKWHTYLWGADKQPNTNTGCFFLWIPKSVDYSDFEHNARNIERHTTPRRLETIVYSNVSVSPWQSPASPIT